MNGPSLRTQFSSHLALADLPWFELRQGDRLVVADPDIGPAIDVHTHFALTYLRRRSVDLSAATAATAATEHYLPLDRAIDLDLYANQNFSEEDLKRLKWDLSLRAVTTGGMRRTHTAANLKREMAELGFRHAAVLPIDFRRFSHNAETFLEVTTRDDAFIPMGSVHPADPGAQSKLELQQRLGAKGIKVHPAVQLIEPDDPRAIATYRLCGEMGLSVMWHCGPVGIETAAGRRKSQVKHYWPAVQGCPETTFILGHSGALQMDLALDLAKCYDNVFLDLACQSLPAKRRILKEGPQDRILFGSDWPFYHQALGLAKVLLATEGDPATRRRVLFDNAARLFGIEASGKA